MISVRSIRSVGIVFVSTDAAVLRMSPATWRRPLTRTSVRWVPSPRRSSKFSPEVPRNRVELDWLKVLCSAGSWFSTSPIEVCPVLKKSSPVIVVTGTADVRLGLRMREPVTTMAVCSSLVCVEAFGTRTVGAAFAEGDVSLTDPSGACAVCAFAAPENEKSRTSEADRAVVDDRAFRITVPDFLFTQLIGNPTAASNASLVPYHSIV